jgi:hypothetical protein
MADPRAKCSDSDFVRLFEEVGPTKLAKQFGITTKSIYQRRASLEGRLGRQITGPEHPQQTRHNVAHPQRVVFGIQDGHVLIGSDAHIWPGPKSTAMRAFIKFCSEVDDLKAVILNGDVMDFPQVSRHPPIGWENHPTVQQEIEAAQDILHEIEMAAPKSRRVWTLGNHDGRFETRLATVAPEFAKIKGIHLRDHFPHWEAGWSCWINDVVIKHRFKGGVHATHNNAVSSGRHMVTGHLHSAKVTPWTDYNGTRYGVDTGCLADPDHRAFVDYTEDNPKNWRSAFGLLTFYRGKLLMPELIQVFDENSVEFQGKVIRV